MIEFTLLPPQEMLSHYVLFGAAQLASDAGFDVRLSWSKSMNPRPCLDAEGLDWERLSELVQVSAQRSAEGWVGQTIPATKSGVFSPRIGTKGWKQDEWEQLQQLRWQHFPEEQVFAQTVQSLGEPNFWSPNDKGDLDPDIGASWLDMQPRNNGSNLMVNRVVKNATATATRSVDLIASGLRGETVNTWDDKADSRNSLNMKGLGSVDDGLSWLATVGIGLAPLAQKVGSGRASVTATSFGGRHQRNFVLPVWHEQLRLARVMTVLRSSALVRAGQTVGTDSVDQEAMSWLGERGIKGLLVFGVHKGGSASAPEYRVREGSTHLID